MSNKRPGQDSTTADTENPEPRDTNSSSLPKAQTGGSCQTTEVIPYRVQHGVQVRTVFRDGASLVCRCRRLRILEIVS